MAKNPTPSLLDPGQIIKRSFNDSDDSLRVDAQITANISGPQEVIISSIDDSITIGDASGNLATVSNGALNVNSTGSSTVTGTVNTNLNGLNTFQTSQYSVGASSVQLTVTPLTNRSSLSIKVITTSNNIVYIGNSSGVTTSTGYPLFNGDGIQLDLTPSDTIYAIASASGQTVAVMELA